jgi:Carboxypeptidase regulatory-like domain/TonB dependent receptor
MRGYALSAISFVVFVFLAATPLKADVGGTILGVVTDPKGAVLRGITVELTNRDTGLDRTATTNDAGSYEFLAVPVGSGYQVTAKGSGFDTQTESGIKLLVNQKYTVNFSLRVGRVTQQVDVKADAVQVESTSTQVGTVIEAAKMTAVPLNGRSFVDLLGLQAGVVPVTSGAEDSEVGGALSVNGQRENANSFQVNGTSVERSYDNGAAVVPVLDSIEEFRLLTSTFDAEYGRFSGAVVNVVTKSGTNSLHGSLFEFLRNEKLDAPGYFDHSQIDPVTGKTIPALPKLIQNQFGGTLGGPVVKNKIFFFGDYQGTRLVNGISTGQIPVPSLSNRNGDFSDVTTTGYAPLTGVVRVSQPTTGTMDQVLSQRLGYPVTPGEPYWVEGCNTSADASVGKCVFPGQVIPQSAWSPAAKGTLSFIPQPSLTSNGAPFYFSNSERNSSSTNTYEGRGDINTAHTGNWMVYYHFDSVHTTTPFGGGNVPGFAAQNADSDQNASISNTLSFGSTAVNELRIGFTRSTIDNGDPLGPFGSVSTWGFESGGLGIVAGTPSKEGVPSISLNQLGVTFGLPTSFTYEPNNIYQINENYSKIWGRHTAKFGADFHYVQFNIRQSIEQNGEFGFGGSETGNDFADFLIGTPDSYGQASNGFVQDARTKYFGAYAQDSFKVKPDLTINYGLRYDISQPFYDTQDRIQVFVPGVQSTKFPNSPTGWIFPGDNGLPSTVSPTRYDNFAPRIGIAYAPGFSDGFVSKVTGGPGKTSIRAGFGIYYTSVDEVPVYYETGDAPFGLFYVSPSLVYLEQPFKSRSSSNDPGQRFPIPTVPAGGSDIDFSTWMPISGSTIVDPHNVLPRTMHYNLNIQRQLTSSTILTLAYVGSEGHHLVTSIEANPGDPTRCLHIAAVFAEAGNPGGGCGPFGEDSIYSINGQTFYGSRPYSVTSGRELSRGLLDFGGPLLYNQNSANSAYNSFQATLEKKAGSLQLLGAYTFSRSMDNSSNFKDGTNPYNPKSSWSLSAYDVTHNLVVSFVYSIPTPRFASSGVGKTFLDGWAVTGITRTTTGIPVTLTQSGDRSLCNCLGADYPNYNGGKIKIYNPRDTASHQFFSTDAFSDEELGVPGDAKRRFFHGPGIVTTDAAVLKDIPLPERFTLEFRAEFFNLFNHAVFATPGGDYNSSTFGRVTSVGPGRIGQMALKLRF